MNLPMHELAEAAISQQFDHNKLTCEQFLNEISATRRCRLRTKWDEVFTVEQLLSDVQTRCRLLAPTSLYGTIGRMARQRGYIEETGVWRAAKRDERHGNRSPECRWVV